MVHLFTHRMVTIGMFILAVIVLMMLTGSWLVANDPLAIDLGRRLAPPSFSYPLGTDHLGRCLFSRLVVGARTTIGITMLTLMIVVFVGIPLGMLSGYLGGRFDSIMMRFLDGASALPEFVVAIAIAGFLGPSLTNLMFAIVWVKWIGYARVARGIVLAERKKDYILAARAAGSNVWNILILHLVKKIIPPILVIGSLDIGKIIMIIAMMSYVGLGAQPPAPEWGAMLNEGRTFFQSHPQLILYPGLAIFIVVIACNLIGEGLRDHLDVKNSKLK
ncbi:ABC transporter permease subunit [Paenibacillus sp. GSMTC-2017]|uniref:nickel transporter permease n=1 Tax=Paenibacillus sp. GSMTC-2017 TaxID=2794350 RepID=UPI0018D8C8C5|nr:nickel transporter permease [Paenibacillus sp. GSMTC-2017]MBH5316994.1 ABC transporter permease subunit [Paenibacillus sp. GSMTC-2017]